MLKLFSFEYKQKILVASVGVVFLLCTGAYSQDALYPSDEASLAIGKKIYEGNCTACHALNEVVIGPALKGIEERRTKEWLISWIKNSQKMIKAGDPTSVALYAEYNNTVMPAYSGYSDEEISAVIGYVVKLSNEVVELKPSDSDGLETDNITADSGVSEQYLIAVIVILVVVLVLILVTLVLVMNILTKYVKKDVKLDVIEKELVEQRFSIRDLVQSNLFIGLTIFIFTAIALKTMIDGAFTIGVQQGYMPSQPIAFSHQLHAGQYEIECQYCHTGVRKAKSANIPSANICMNCHTAIKTESPEIAKIYKAIDYDPKTQTYGDNVKPIEWIRIHNLPDLAYFNHSQHVAVGGINCQQCHGPIEEMPVVYQYSELTMGWCINCHRETNVNSAGNAYYAELENQHAKPMKVEDIGGLECSKCHY